MNNWKCQCCIYWNKREGINHGECHWMPPKNKLDMSTVSRQVERYIVTFNSDYCGQFKELRNEPLV